MWHFGRDSLIEVSGEGYHETVESSEHILERYYTKDLKGKRVLRDELIEYPNKSHFEAIEDKLNYVNNVTQSDNAISVEDFP
jgi:hypothetical protein